jgi:hypothetical protein
MLFPLLLRAVSWFHCRHSVREEQECQLVCLCHELFKPVQLHVVSTDGDNSHRFGTAALFEKAGVAP